MEETNTLEVSNASGIDYDVRPPILEFNIKSETKNYTEYEIITHKNADKKKGDNPFLNSLNSMIFCNDKLNIKLPTKNYMIKDGKKRFAYAIGMFPNPKNGKAAYLDGCILAALGLKRQKTNADVICFITHDISTEDKKKLEVVFDKVMYVPYISPYDMGGEGDLETIKMDPDLFKNCPNYTKKHPYTHVFFKLHIFNPELFPYEKVCFVDSDLVPMNYYDSLFMLDCPAGFVEYRKKIPYLEAFSWDRCDFLEHGKPIPKELTDIDKPTGADVNAGLLLVKPDKKEYDSMIKELTSKVNTWMGKNKTHKGFYSFNFDKPDGREFIEDSYCYPEQNYLTKRFSGKWKYIEFAFQSWGRDPCNSFGIHMAAFNPKPWFKQPIGTNIKIGPGKNIPYSKGKQKILPLALSNSKDSNFENITFSYEIFNEVIIWGMVNYPELTKFFTHGVEIHGTKISFDKDTFDKLSKKDNKQFKLLKNIDKNDKYYNRLSISQKYISDLINNNEKTANKLKDNYLLICKSRLKNNEDKYDFDFDILNYPDHIDSSDKKMKKLIDENKMPFGNHKGKLIENLDEKYVKDFTKSKPYKNDKKLRDIFLKYHSEIINNMKGGDWIDDKLAEIKSDMRKSDIVEYCKKYVSYQRGIGNDGVSVQDCYYKQLQGPESEPEDRNIPETEVRSNLMKFAESNNTKENNPAFHTKLIKLVETLNEVEEPLSRKLIRFLIDIGEIKEQTGGKKKKTKRKTETKRKKKIKKKEKTKRKNKKLPRKKKNVKGGGVDIDKLTKLSNKYIKSLFYPYNEREAWDVDDDHERSITLERYMEDIEIEKKQLKRFFGYDMVQRDEIFPDKSKRYVAKIDTLFEDYKKENPVPEEAVLSDIILSTDKVRDLFESLEGAAAGGSLKKNEVKLKRKYSKNKTIKKAPLSECKLYYFTMNGCPHCMDFNETWEQLIDDFPNINAEKIEHSENIPLIQKYGISSFPKIILDKQNTPIHYDKEREINELSNFLKTHINMV